MCKFHLLKTLISGQAVPWCAWIKMKNEIFSTSVQEFDFCLFWIFNLHGHWRTWLLVDWRAGSRQSEPPHPLPCPWRVHSAHHSHSRSCFKDVVLRGEGIEAIWMVYKLLRFCCVYRDLLVLQTPQPEKHHRWVPFLTNPAIYQPGVGCLFLQSSPSMYWGQFQISPRELPGCKPTMSICIFLVLKLY